MKDFLISYNQMDQEVAEWIANLLKGQGYEVAVKVGKYQAWEGLVEQIQTMLHGWEHFVLLLSDAYLEEEYAKLEWGVALCGIPDGVQSRIIPIRISSVRRKGLLTCGDCIDIYNMDRKRGEEKILKELRQDRANEARRFAYSNGFGYGVRERVCLNTHVFPKPLRRNVEDLLSQRMLNGDAAARELLYQHNLRLVINMMRRYRSYAREIEVDVLFRVGCQGLSKGLDTFGETEKKFSAYLSRCIEREILKMLPEKVQASLY